MFELMCRRRLVGFLADLKSRQRVTVRRARSGEPATVYAAQRGGQEHHRAATDADSQSALPWSLVPRDGYDERRMACLFEQPRVVEFARSDLLDEFATCVGVIDTEDVVRGVRVNQEYSRTPGCSDHLSKCLMTCSVSPSGSSMVRLAWSSSTGPCAYGSSSYPWATRLHIVITNWSYPQPQRH
jgi:hypothetical protein